MSLLFDFDKNNKKSKFLIGTDEAGRGPLAGPVVAAAVCFKDVTLEILELLDAVNDSKKLTHKKRAELFEIIKEHSVYSIKVVDVKEIEKINILQAALKAMRLSCEEVASQLDGEAEVFVDGNKKVPNLKLTQRTIVKGDGTSASIAAASILAKVYRDELMCEYAKKFPEYGWENNKGYGSAKHIEALKKYGVTKHHRKSFLKNILLEFQPVQTKLEF